MGHLLRRFLSFGVLLCLFALTTCAPPELTPVVVQPIIVIDLTDALPGSPTPDFVRDLTCADESDCVLAYRSDLCCDCDEIYSRAQVENDPRLRFSDETKECCYKTPRIEPNRRWRCPDVMCAPCQAPPVGLVCDSGACRAAQFWREILPLCPLQEQGQMANGCYYRAALDAAQAGEASQAASVCAGFPVNIVGEAVDTEQCLLALARALMEQNPYQAVDFCRADAGFILARCLAESAREVAKKDLNAGLSLCAEISAQPESDGYYRDTCFHSIALLIAHAEPERARQICEQMSGRVDECKKNVGNQ